MKNGSKSVFRRVLIIMGIFTMLFSLFGCTKDNNPDIKNENGEGAGQGGYRKVAGLSFGVSGYGPGWNYNIQKSEEDNTKTIMTCEDFENSIREISCEVDDGTLESISKLMERLNIQSWNGFSKSNDFVLDGEGFSLSVDFEDGKHIYASGSNSFPKNYSEFESEFLEIVAPLVDGELARLRDKMKEEGKYSEKLEMAMINYNGRGKSGSDAYNILIRDGSSTATKADIEINSLSGEFIEPGKYRYFENPDDTDELLAKIQAVLEKYDVYKWDGYDKSTDDYNDREWFQLDFLYPEAKIGCCGCGDTEHYAEVRKELLEIICEYVGSHVQK